MWMYTNDDAQFSASENLAAKVLDSNECLAKLTFPNSGFSDDM